MTRSAPLLAKRLLEPTWLSHPAYVETFGPEVGDICTAADFAPDPEQQLCLDLIFAVDESGKSAAFEIDVIAARQNLKTGLLLQAELGWLFITEERLIVHSAHELSTTEEAFILLSGLIEDCPSLSKHLAQTRGERKGIREGNGMWGIELASKQRVKYKARTKGGGRGLSGDKVVLDEAFALEPTHMGALLPTLSARPDPQVIKASSAGKVGSLVLIEARDRGRLALSPRQVYVEWGDKNPGGCKAGVKCDHAKDIPGCALDDEKRWATIMPALGGRVSVETIRALRQSMPPEEFAREFMVWWDIEEDAPPATIDFAKWSKLVNRKAKQPDRATVVIDVSPLRMTSSIGIGAAGKNGRTLVMTKSGEGTAWVVPALKKLQKKRDIVEVALFPGGQAGGLIPALIKAGIEYEALTAQEMGRACSWVQTAIRDATLEHVGQAALDTAVQNATVRDSGEAEMWDRRDKAIDISQLVAGGTAGYRWSLLDADDYDTSESYL